MSSVDSVGGLERIEAVVLGRILELHPALVTMAELLQDLRGGAGGEGRADVEAATRSLTQAGLLHPVGQEDRFITPTRAAVHLEELREIG